MVGRENVLDQGQCAASRVRLEVVPGTTFGVNQQRAVVAVAPFIRRGRGAARRAGAGPRPAAGPASLRTVHAAPGQRRPRWHRRARSPAAPFRARRLRVGAACRPVPAIGADAPAGPICHRAPGRNCARFVRSCAGSGSPRSRAGGSALTPHRGACGRAQGRRRVEQVKLHGVGGHGRRLRGRRVGANGREPRRVSSRIPTTINVTARATTSQASTSTSTSGKSATLGGLEQRHGAGRVLPGGRRDDLAISASAL